MRILVDRVLINSIAEELNIESGDEILLINGEKVLDVFEYRFLTTQENLTIELLKKDGDIWELEIEKDEYEDLGIEFENSMLDDAKSCTNDCIFCFIDQLPKNMRETLYFKDDDSRLSFLTGNYVTLTNMKDEDLDRIIKYKLSPINISVHTTNPELRIKMLNNKFAGDILNRIKRLINSGITVNCQIVLCRDINDTAELDRTLKDLTGLYPKVYSISIVPVGITKYRQGLKELKAFDKEYSISLISQVQNWQKKLFEEFGSNIVYLADEIYIKAEVELPNYEHYQDFPQIENGVGLVSMLLNEVEVALKKINKKNIRKRILSIATGVSSKKYIEMIALKLNKRYNIEANVYQIKNDYFGETVTVTGLLTGIDIYNQLIDKDLGDELLLCKSMLKKDEEIFLDDYTVEFLSKKLNVKIILVENDGEDLVRKILGV